MLRTTSASSELSCRAHTHLNHVCHAVETVNAHVLQAGHCPIHQAFVESVDGPGFATLHDTGPSAGDQARSKYGHQLVGCGRGAQNLTLGDFLHGRIVEFLGHSLVGFPFSLGVFHQDASDVHRSSPQPFPEMLLYAVPASKTPDGGTLPVMLKTTAAMSATLTSEWLID